MAPPTRFVTTDDGVRIGYCVHGQGPPVVLVRGWLSHVEGMWDHAPFRSFIESLGEHFQVVRYDTRGQGVSDRNIDTVDLDALTTDVTAVVDRLGLTDIVLWGQTYGAPIALAYAAAQPDRVSKLIVDGGYARGGDIMPAERRRHFLATVAELWPDSLSLLSHFTNPDPRPDQDSARRRAWASRTVTGEMAARLFGFAFTVDVSHLVSEVSVPTLVMHRRESRAVPVSAARKLAVDLPDASLVILDGSAHNSWEGDAEQTLDVLGEFLGVSLPKRVSSGATGGPLAILFTDIEGSTDLTSQLGDQRAHQLVRTHDQIVRTRVEHNGGQEVKHTGDGIMATFASISGALRAAIEIQQDLSAGEIPFRVRIGVDAGEPLRQGPDLTGTVVQSARRITDHAEPGTILVSDVVRRLVAGSGLAFLDRGQTSLKGLPDPTHLYEVAWST